MIVSIVTPSLNGIEHLRECIESVRDQEGAGVTVEHIIVDGGSSDGTPELARSLGCTVLTREERSPYAAINKGSYHAAGALLGTIGCDDIMLPGALRAVVRQHQDTGVRWLVGGTRWLTRRGARGIIKPPPRWLSASMLASLGWCCIPHISTFVHRGLFEDMGGYDSTFLYAGDYEFFARLLRRREPFASLDGPLCISRREGGNWSLSANATRDGECEWIRERYGPALPWQRSLYRYTVKAWLNGTNPRWFAYKRADEILARFQPMSPGDGAQEE